MRRSGVRIPLAPPQTDIRSGCRFFVCRGELLLVALLVFYVPSARPRAVRAASFARRVDSRPALALPPPTGTAARPLYRAAASTPAASGVLVCGGPGPAAAHRHRGLAPPARTGTAASPAYNAIPAAGSARSYVGVEPLFRAADHVEASSHDVRHRGSAPGLAANRRAMTAPSNA